MKPISIAMFWPWLWWQLRALARWRRETGRGLLIAADHWGNIHIVQLGDDPRAPRPGIISVSVSNRLALALSELRSQWSRRMPGLPEYASVFATSDSVYGFTGPIPDT